jgi:uncharacterized damage-inducible protein DinB
MTTKGIRRMYAHLEWANQRLLGSLTAPAPQRDHPAYRLFSHVGLLQRAGQTPLSHVRPAMRVLSHLVASERVWLLRLLEQDSGGQAIWPTLTAEEVEALARANALGYRRLLDTLTDSDLSRPVEYTNQQGRRYRTAIGDILVHVAMHGSYHRGQIASAMRDAGGEPVNTDYITYVRETAEALDAA